MFVYYSNPPPHYEVYCDCDTLPNLQHTGGKLQVTLCLHYITVGTRFNKKEWKLKRKEIEEKKFKKIKNKLGQKESRFPIPSPRF